MITTIERCSRMRTVGQQIDIRAQAVLMMRMMGIEAAVRADSVKEVGGRLIDQQGRVKATFPAETTGGQAQGPTFEFEIMRGDLVRILYGLTEKSPNVQHLYNTSIETFTQDGESNPHGKVHVTFNNGHMEDFDIVVGADGTGSKTRKIMLGPDAPDPRTKLGGHIAFFSVPSEPWDSNWGTVCHLPGREGDRLGRWAMTRKDCPEFTRVYLISKSEGSVLEVAQRSGDLSELKKAWADHYSDCGWECPRFMDALLHSPEADDLYATPLEMVQLPEGLWSKGRVAVVGDAAHCSTAGGFSTSWGLIGPYILAGEIATQLAKDSSLPTMAVIQATKSYEERFRPIPSCQQESAGRADFVAFPRTNLGIRLLHLSAWVASKFGLGNMSPLTSELKKWTIPEYPALERGAVIK